MKRLLASVLCLLTVCALAQVPMSKRIPFFKHRVAAAGGGGPTPIMVESFDTNPGYDLSGYTESGVVHDPDYVTAPAPLKGTQSFNFYSASYAYRTFGNQSEVWVYFMINISLAGSGTWDLMGMTAEDGFPSVYVESAADGKLRLVSGAVNGAYTTDAMATATTYHVWVHYNQATQSGDLEFSTGNRTGSGNKYTTISGAANKPSGVIVLGSQAAGNENAIEDDFEIFTSDPGNTPP